MGFGGGILNAESTVTLNYSTLANNSGSNGGGIASYDGTLIIENSTLSGNMATFHGGGMFIDYSNDVTLQHSTIVDNVADVANNIIIFNVDSTEKRPKTGFLHMNHSGNFGRALEKPGFFSEIDKAPVSRRWATI